MFQHVLIHKVEAFARTVLQPDSSVVVAVSGGSDSVALLFLLNNLKEKLGISKLVVAHVNYQLRGIDSDEDELLVRRHAELLGIPFFLKRVQGHSLAEPGMENWARQERYTFLHEIRSQTGCSLIATGHTLDDQAETILMRMLRGTGLNGLRGVMAVREDGVVRPLLSVKKTEIVAWLTAEKIGFRYDSSNSDVHLLRNRVRREILPLLEQCHPGAMEHCAACALEAQKQWNMQQVGIDEWKRINYQEFSGDAFRIWKSGLHLTAKTPEALRQLFVKHGITPDRYHITAVLSMIDNGGSTVLLPDGWFCQTGSEYLYFAKRKAFFSYAFQIPGQYSVGEEMQRITFTIEPSPPKKLDCGKLTVYIDGDKMDDGCAYRSITPDDTFIPFGRKNSVNVFEFLSKQGLLKPDREHCGILTTNDNKPVWVYGIRLDDRFRITSATKKVIKVQSSSIL
jgi:tRNA(Ile)-lysidine synthase